MNQMEQQYDGLIKIVIVGNCNVGKSCILMRYSEDVFTSQYYNTIGVDFKTRLAKIGEQRIKLQIWDTAGQERFKALTNNYYRDAHGIVIVYDVTEKSTFDAIDAWMDDIEKYGQRNVCKLLVGNKADCESKKKISKEEGEFKAKQFNSLFLETSAKTAENVQKIFQLICHQILDFRKDQNKSPPRTSMSNNNLNKPTNKGCC